MTVFPESVANGLTSSNICYYLTLDYPYCTATQDNWLTTVRVNPPSHPPTHPPTLDF